MRNKITHILLMTLVPVMLTWVLSACTYHGADHHSDWILTEAQRDSIAFSESHHYNVGYNFILAIDSIRLAPTPDGWSLSLDYAPATAVLYKGDDFVVTEIFHSSVVDSLRNDSVWLRVGSDGIPLGWVLEADLLESSTPTDPISRFIHMFSGTHLYALYVILLITAVIVGYRLRKHRSLWLVHFNDVQSAYPRVFCMVIATAAMLYASIQLMVPDTWVEFYFHPTLNPLGQPPVISAFLVSVWLCLILLLSVVYDLMEKVSFLSLCSYLLSLIAWGGVVYVVLTLSIQYYFGYGLYLAYMIYVIYSLFRRKPAADKQR